MQYGLPPKKNVGTLILKQNRMKKFNHLLLFVEMLFIIAVFSSCANDNSISPKKYLSLEELKVEMKTKSEQSWQDFKTQNADILIEKDGYTFLSSNKNGEGIMEIGDEDECDCSYEILEVNVVNPPGFPNELFELFSVSQCPSDCHIFSGVGGLTECASSSDPNCFLDEWDEPYNDEFHSFNCILPAHAVFPVTFNAIALGASCFTAGYLENIEIKFKIHCVGADLSMPDCSVDPNRPLSLKNFISDEIVMTVDNTTGPGFLTLTNIVVELQDCGCQPVELAVIQGN
jgi:hypothetical protein